LAIDGAVTATLNLNRLTIAHGNADQGGGIVLFGSGTLSP